MGKHYWKEILAKVLEMKEAGRTHKEIGEQLGYSKEQIKRLVERYHKKQREQPIPKRRGRPRSTPLTKEE